jgi:hypothetical protein
VLAGASRRAHYGAGYAAKNSTVVADRHDHVVTELRRQRGRVVGVLPLERHPARFRGSGVPIGKLPGLFFGAEDCLSATSGSPIEEAAAAAPTTPCVCSEWLVPRQRHAGRERYARAHRGVAARSLAWDAWLGLAWDAWTLPAGGGWRRDQLQVVYANRQLSAESALFS